MLAGIFSKASEINGLGPCLKKGSELISVFKETYDLVQQDQRKFIKEKPNYEKQNFDELYFKAVANVCNEPTETTIRNRWDVRAVTYVSENQRKIKSKSVEILKKATKEYRNLKRSVNSNISSIKKRASSVGKQISVGVIEMGGPFYRCGRDFVLEAREKSQKMKKQFIDLPLKKISTSLEPACTMVAKTQKSILDLLTEIYVSSVKAMMKVYEEVTEYTPLKQIKNVIVGVSQYVYNYQIVPFQSLLEKNGNAVYQYVMVWREMFQELAELNRSTFRTLFESNWKISKMYISSMDYEIFYAKGKSYKIKKDTLEIIRSIIDILSHSKQSNQTNQYQEMKEVEETFFENQNEMKLEERLSEDSNVKETYDYIEQEMD